AVGQYTSIYAWATLVCGYYFPRRFAAAHLAWLLITYAAALAAVESTAGYSPVTRWLFTAASLTVVMMIVNVAVPRRARPDQGAKRCVDVCEDVLSTIDDEGRCVDVNAAWKRHLGYAPEELRGRPLLDLTHPDDRQRALTIVRAEFDGTAGSLDTRVRARD